MKRTVKQVLSLIIAIAIILGSMPLSIFAQSSEIEIPLTGENTDNYNTNNNSDNNQSDNGDDQTDNTAVNTTAHTAQPTSTPVATPTQPTAQPKVTITADVKSVYRGEEVRFVISASDVEAVRAYGALFSYDETVFELISAEILFDGAFISDVDIKEGVVVALWQKPIDINGDIISFVLKVKDDAPLGEHEISAEVSLREDGDCNLNVNTVINVFEQEPTAKPTAQPTVEPTTEPTAQPTSAPTATPTTKPTAEPKVTIAADRKSVSRGEKVRFVISASDVEPVTSYGAFFSYNETVFELISAEILTAKGVFSDASISDGSVVNAFVKKEDINGDIISFVLKVKDDAILGEHEISTTVSFRGDSDCDLNVNTVINVSEQEPTAKPTAQPTVGPTTEPTATPTTKPTAEPTAQPTNTPSREPVLITNVDQITEGHVKLNNDITGTIDLSKGTYVIDLAGKKWTITDYRSLGISGSANVTIKDSVGGGVIYAENNDAVVINTTGRVILDGITIKADDDLGTTDAVFVNGGNVTVKNCVLKASRASLSNYNANNTTVKVIGCELDGDTYALIVKNNGVITIGAGTKFNKTTVEMRDFDSTRTFADSFIAADDYIIKFGESVWTERGFLLTEVTKFELCSHEYGAWKKHNEKQHKKTCECGKAQYADHIWNDGEVTKPSTHTTVGEKTYTCKDCAEIKSEEIAKTPEHEHGKWEKHNETQHKKTCACGDVQYADHAWNDGEVTKPSTHTTVGEKTYTCTECGETKSEEIAKTPEHEHGKWEKHNETQHKKTCACGDVQYADHEWDDGVETTPATHTTVGEKTYTCTECRETKSEEIAKTPEHEHGKWEKHNEIQHKKTCACGDIRYANHKWDDGVETTPATHTTVGEKTYTCTECGETKSEEIAKTPEHEHGKWEKHNETQHKKTCACGDVQYADHAWNDGEVTTPSTHTTVGEKTYTCTDCGETKTEEIAKTPEHEHGAWEKYNETQHKKTCACGDVQYADHAWNENGKQCICADCAAILEKILPSEESNVIVNTEKSLVSGIKAESKPADVIAQFEGSDNIQIVGKDGKALADDALVGTGCKVQLVENGEVKDEVTVVIKGEIDGNGKIDSDDAIYLLRNTLFASLYPVVVDDDVDGNGEYNSDDAIHLLRHTLFPSMYPLK